MVVAFQMTHPEDTAWQSTTYRGGAMRFSQVSRKVMCAVVVAGMALMLPGCGLNSPTEADHSQAAAQLASDEVSNMGVDAGNVMSGVGLGKMVAGTADTSYIDWHVTPYRLDTASVCYVRTATFSTSAGYERTRIDTITFFDANGNKLAHPTIATVSTIHHVRHVEHSNGGEVMNVVFDMTSVLTKGTDTTMVKNGTMTGTYAGDAVSSGSMVNVTRKYTNGHWQFPESGTVSATFPRFTFSIVYLGAGQATATLTNTVKNKTTIVNIQVDQR
jgi:hypothetical protein